MEQLPIAALLILSAGALVAAIVASSQPRFFDRLTGPPQALTFAWLAAATLLSLRFDALAAVVATVVVGVGWGRSPRTTHGALELGFAVANLAFNVVEIIGVQNDETGGRAAVISVTVAVVIGASFAGLGAIAPWPTRRPGSLVGVAASLVASTELIVRVMRPDPSVDLVLFASIGDKPEGLAALLLATSVVVICGSAPREFLGIVGVGLAVLDMVLSVASDGEAAATVMLSCIGVAAIRFAKPKTSSNLVVAARR